MAQNQTALSGSQNQASGFAGGLLTVGAVPLVIPRTLDQLPCLPTDLCVDGTTED